MANGATSEPHLRSAIERLEVGLAEMLSALWLGGRGQRARRVSRLPACFPGSPAAASTSQRGGQLVQPFEAFAVPFAGKAA